jgi:hypothetical protein
MTFLSREDSVVLWMAGSQDSAASTPKADRQGEDGSPPAVTARKNGAITSIGIGNTMVLFFSTAISVSVWSV